MIRALFKQSKKLELKHLEIMNMSFKIELMFIKKDQNFYPKDLNQSELRYMNLREHFMFGLKIQMELYQRILQIAC